MIQEHFFDLLSALIVVAVAIYIERRYVGRERQEKTDRKNLVLEIDKKINKVQHDLTFEIRDSYDRIITAVNAQYVRKEQFDPFRDNVTKLEKIVADHGTRITRIEATHEGSRINRTSSESPG